MARNAIWTNTDGLVVGYGARTSLVPVGATVETKGNVCIHTQIIDHASMPVTANTAWKKSGGNLLSYNVPIPAYAIITRATFQCLETFADADANPSMTLGLVTVDNTEIDNDGLFKALTEASGKLTAGATTVASLYDAGVADGAATTYQGALIGNDIGSAAGYITAVLSTGGWDSGKGVITVEYILQIPDDEPTSPYSTTTKLT